MRHRRIWPAAAVGFVLVAAACASAPEATTTTAPETTTTTVATTTTAPEAAGPSRSPSALEAEAQTSDGTTVTIASVTLPAPGFVAVHAAGDGGPGPVIGVSDLLPEGTSTDVVVTLDTPLEASAAVFPMVHIDMNQNGAYDFAPPDVTTDVPGLGDDEQSVAVTKIEITVEG